MQYRIILLLQFALVYHDHDHHYLYLSQYYIFNFSNIFKKKPWAYVRMAARYEAGVGVKKSLKKAIDNYKRGMELGDPRCMNALGHLYRTGKGVACDIVTINVN